MVWATLAAAAITAASKGDSSPPVQSASPRTNTLGAGTVTTGQQVFNRGIGADSGQVYAIAGAVALVLVVLVARRTRKRKRG